MSANATDRAARVRLMIFDVDGIMTDGGLHYGADGEVFKTFNVLDGHGLKLLQQSGVVTAIISARQSSIVERRAADLGITHVRQGIHDKRAAFEQLLAETGVSPDETGYIGDDVIDLPILLGTGFAASVPNAHPEVQARVHYMTRAGGGAGAVRELCDFILRAQGKYEAMLVQYLGRGA